MNSDQILTPKLTLSLENFLSYRPSWLENPSPIDPPNLHLLMNRISEHPNTFLNDFFNPFEALLGFGWDFSWRWIDLAA
jgi:hypothetical protein